MNKTLKFEFMKADSTFRPHIGDSVTIKGMANKGILKVEQRTNEKGWFVVGRPKELPKILVNVSDMKKVIPKKRK